MPGDDGVGVFSLARWGVGGTTMISVLTLAASVLLALWFRYHAVAALVFSAITYFSVGVVVFVKINEEIHPTRLRFEDVVGRTGVVVNDPSPSRPPVVKVGSQLWSAKPMVELERGDVVVVRGREGLYLVVEKAQTTTQPA